MASEPQKKQQASVKCMIFYDGRILLLQKKDQEGLRPWEFPGGGLQFGETFEEAARREVREETGVEVDILSVAGVWSYARHSNQFLTGFIFTAEAHTNAVRLSEEHTDYVWAKPSDIYEYSLQPSLLDAIERLTYPSKRGEELLVGFLDARDAAKNGDEGRD